MPPTITIRTKLPKSEVLKQIKNLPAILAGKVSDPLGLRRAFFGAAANRIMTILSQSFAERARTLTDSYTNVWKAHRPSTIAYRLRASTARKYPLAPQLLVMRLSDRLYSSLKPGVFTGLDYFPRPEQLYTITSSTVQLGSEVPYAQAASAKRPIFPTASTKSWVDQGIQAGLDNILYLVANHF